MKQQDKKENNGGFNMIKTLRKQLKNEKGLTLIELLAVIVILAIIAAIAIPAIGNIIANSKYNAVKSDAINVINAAQLYYLDNPDSDKDVHVYELQGKENESDDTSSEAVFLENPGTIPADAKISNESPYALTTADGSPVEFDGNKVIFRNATIQIINADNTKGSKIEDGEKTIGSE